jgi:hypothetical protein
MRDLAERFGRRVGRRGAFLLFLAILDVVFASYLLNPPAGLPAQTYPLLPGTVWGTWWAATGVVCIFGAFLKVDRVAYGLAALLKAAWGLRYAYLWYTGVSESWAAMTVWLVFAVTVLIVAGWPEEIVNLQPGSDIRDR